jgi:hypothetical protein
MFAVTHFKMFSYSPFQPRNLFKIYRSIILSVVLHWNVIWSLALREDFRLNVLRSRAIKKIFASKKGKQMHKNA